MTTNQDARRVVQGGTENPGVGGSIPSLPTIFLRELITGVRTRLGRRRPREFRMHAAFFQADVLRLLAALGGWRERKGRAPPGAAGEPPSPAVVLGA